MRFLFLLLALCCLALPAEATWPTSTGIGAGVVSQPCGGPLSVTDFTVPNWSVEWNDMRPGEVLLHTWQVQSVDDGSGPHTHRLDDVSNAAHLWSDRFEIAQVGAVAPLVGHGLGSLMGGVGETGSFQIQIAGNDSGGILSSEAHGAAGGAYVSWFPLPATDKTFVLVSRFKVESAAQQSFFFGLAQGPATTILGATGSLGTGQQYIGFHHAQTDGSNVDLATRWSDLTETRTQDVFTFSDDQPFDVAISMDQGETPGSYTHRFWYRTTVGTPWTLGGEHVQGAKNLTLPLRLTFGTTGDLGAKTPILWMDFVCWAMRRFD